MYLIELAKLVIVPNAQTGKKAAVHHLPVLRYSNIDCILPFNVLQTVEDREPFALDVAAAMLSVLSADKSPPPVKGDVVLIILVVATGV